MLSEIMNNNIPTPSYSKYTSNKPRNYKLDNK